MPWKLKYFITVKNQHPKISHSLKSPFFATKYFIFNKRKQTPLRSHICQVSLHTEKGISMSKEKKWGKITFWQRESLHRWKLMTASGVSDEQGTNLRNCRNEFVEKGWLGIANLKKIYKDRLDLGVTWLKWLPHSMEQYGRLAPKSNKVNYQKLTLS